MDRNGSEVTIENSKVSLSSDRLILREFTTNDWNDVHTYASQNIVCQYQPWGPNTEEDSENFVKQVVQDSKQQPRVRFALAIIYHNVLVGAGEINISDSTNKVGEVSYIVHPEFWGKGIATEATNLLINFGFEVLKLHRIYATCDPRNIGSSNVLEKVGMTKEGRIRESLLIKDGWRDSLLYSILEQEWER